MIVFPQEFVVQLRSGVLPIGLHNKIEKWWFIRLGIYSIWQVMYGKVLSLWIDLTDVIGTMTCDRYWKFPWRRTELGWLCMFARLRRSLRLLAQGRRFGVFTRLLHLRLREWVMFTARCDPLGDAFFVIFHIKNVSDHASWWCSKSGASFNNNSNNNNQNPKTLWFRRSG